MAHVLEVGTVAVLVGEWVDTMVALQADEWETFWAARMVQWWAVSEVDESELRQAASWES